MSKQLDDFRAANPAYKDTPEGELAYGIWNKSYSGKLGMGEFADKLGLSGNSFGQMIAAGKGRGHTPTSVVGKGSTEPVEWPKAEYGGNVGGTIRAAAQGVTAGGSDELVAGIGAGVKTLYDDRPYGEIYDEILLEERARMEQFSDDEPALALGAEIVGAVASPLNKLAMAANVAKVGITGAKTAMAAKTALVAAPYGFLSSDGTVTDRVQDAASAAIVAPLFGAGMQKMFNLSLPVVDRVWGGIKKGTPALPKTLEGLKKAKNNAYDLVKEHGIRFSGSDINRGFNKFVGEVQQGGNYTGKAEKQATAVIAMFKSLVPKARGRGVELKDVDKMQQNMWGRYNDKSTTNPEKDVILAAINQLDDMLLTVGGASETMVAARVAQKQFKLAETLTNVKTKIDNAQKSVSQGSKPLDELSRWKKAITKILENPKQARFLEPSEVKAFQDFVDNQGPVSDKVLAKIGTLSPMAGLSQLMHMGAAFSTGGASLALSVGTSKVAAGVAKRQNARGPELLNTVGLGNKPAAQQAKRQAFPAGAKGATAVPSAAVGGMLTGTARGEDERDMSMLKRNSAF